MPKWKYANLDAIRGLAAILIVFRHAPLLFHAPRFQQSYLAVDLFFVISGFVVANAYEARLRSGALGFGAFAKLRLIRLYPLYLVGITIGLISFFVSMAHLHAQGEPPKPTVLVAGFVVLSLLMLPAHGKPLYLVDNPAWSLLYEIIANLAFARIVRGPVVRILIGVMIPSAAVIAWYALDQHGIDEGWDLAKWYLALARVGFSFSAGVLLFRLHRHRQRGAQVTHTRNAALSLCSVAATLVMLCVTIPHRWAGFVVLAEVFVLIPLIVHVAISCEPPAFVAPVCAQLGRVSYGLYIVHAPVLLLIYRLTENHEHVYGGRALAAFVVAMLLFVALLDRYVDTPLRAWLSRVGRRELDVPVQSRV